MSKGITRRRALLAAAGVARTSIGAARPEVVESHVHLFDPDRVPYAPLAPYKPPAYTLEQHLALVREAGLTHSIIVHPEPYQNDHRYTEYCLAHEPSPGYFKATCLFDPLRDDTPERVRALIARWPKRFIAMRIHAVKMTPQPGGSIANRDLRDPRMLVCWKALADIGLGVEMHCIPGQARNIRALAEQLPNTTVIIDHMGRPASGSDAEYEEILRLSELPRVVMKYSGWDYYKGDLNQLTRRIYKAFGPDRMIWGTLGNTLPEYQENSQRFDELLAFAPERDRDKIRGGTAQRLFFNH